jgi:hypothetical protein
MPIIPLNWARLYAENGASVWDLPAQYAVERDGKALDAKPAEDAEQDAEDTGRAADFATMVTESSLDVVLAEAERRSVLARTAFLRVHSDSVEAAALRRHKEPRTVVTVFLPCDVYVLPHPQAPTSLDACLALLARVSGGDGVAGASTTWEVWTRAVDSLESPTPTFGPWRVERIVESSSSDARGKSRTDVTITVIHEVYPAPSLPWVAMHHGLPEGCPYVDADRNLVHMFNTTNANLMSETFSVDMCAAPILVRLSDAPAPKTIALGPGMMPTIPRNEDIRSVTQTTDFAGMRAANRSIQASLAITSRQRPEGYDTEAEGAPASGTALKIKNEPQSKARLEAVARAVATARRLLEIMVEVHDIWRGTSIGGDGVTFKMTPQDPPEYEDKSVTVKRWIDLRDAGLASDEEVRVASGASRSLDEARAALEKIRAERAAQRPNGLAAALDQRMGAVEADDADIRDSRTESEAPRKGPIGDA